MRGRLSFLSATTAAVLALAALTGVPPRSAAAADEATAAVHCTGSGAVDAAEPACGLRLAPETRTFTWPHDATPVATALAAPRLAFHGTPPLPGARPLDFVTVWHRDEATGAWRAWASQAGAPFGGLTTLERGATYTIASRADLDLSLAPPRPSAFAGTRVVSLYGHPGVPTMGALGTYRSAGAAADAVEAYVAEYQALDTAAGRGTRVVGALHLIVSVAQADPGWDGTYLGRMALADIAPYVEATRARGQLLFLDVQVGWADPLVEVQRLEPLLHEPHVHLALDPEFATKAKGWPPGESIGFLTPEQVNAVQRYLLDVTLRAATTSKVLVLHQFRADMLFEPERIEPIEGVDVVIDMDGWGPPGQKVSGYQAFALAPYAEHPGFKLFIHWDVPLMTPAEVMALSTPPDYVIYQ